MDSDITLQELTDAVKQISLRHSPGIDGITTDFYHYFWNVLGQDFYEVAKECFENGFIPSSCRRAVLSLLPKKGDVGFLKNWRPVSVLCTDYKMLAKYFQNKFKQYLDTIIHSDQTYYVPELSIMDNFFLLRDAVDLSFKENINMGFLSIDQGKTFDRVDHGYLFSALRSFGFGERFIYWVKLLYRDVSIMVKVGGGLSASVTVKRGIRQGCPLPGQLYSIAIEPLLRRIRIDLKGFLMPNEFNCNKIVLSAYADGVTVFINGQEDVINLTKSIEVYERASTAKVNWSKCEGYAVGQWINQRLPDLPGGLK